MDNIEQLVWDNTLARERELANIVEPEKALDSIGAQVLDSIAERAVAQGNIAERAPVLDSTLVPAGSWAQQLEQEQSCNTVQKVAKSKQRQRQLQMLPKLRYESWCIP